jgi:hypothetical protein
VSLEADLERIVLDMKAVMHQQRQLAARMADLHAARDALMAALSTDATTAALTLPDLGGLTRAQAIEVVLRSAGGPLGPSDIQKAFRRRGRQDESLAAVTGSLSDMAHRGRVQRISHGLYVSVNESRNQE